MYNDTLSPNIFKPRNDWNLTALKSRQITIKSDGGVSVDRIADIILDKYGTHPFVETNYRGRNHVTARQILMIMLRRHTGKSLQKIGNIIGAKDHTTVLHGIKTIKNLCETNREFREVFTEIDKEVSRIARKERLKVIDLKSKIPSEV